MDRRQLGVPAKPCQPPEVPDGRHYDQPSGGPPHRRACRHLVPVRFPILPILGDAPSRPDVAADRTAITRSLFTPLNPPARRKRCKLTHARLPMQ
jgi:hypothetical protein